VELRDSAPTDCDRLDNGHTEIRCKTSWVEFEAIAFGKIDHVERNDGREPKLDQLKCEAKVIVEVRGIENNDERVWLPLAMLPTEQDIARHGFVGARRFEAIRTREVDELDGSSIGERQAARVALDSDARIISNLLARSRQRIEQSALAGIGTAGDGDERQRVHC
jgi:hypothetical protein